MVRPFSFCLHVGRERTIAGLGGTMNLCATISRSRLLVAMAVTLTMWAPAGAIRFDWTEQEIRCAQRVGVDLLSYPKPGSSDYVKRLAWLADLVVYGTVAKIRHDPKGAYHTQVRIDVLSVRKGQRPKGRLTLALMSGPVFVPSTNQTFQQQSFHEPSFAKGETVLLFLTKGPLESDAQSYELPENAYCLVNNAKLRIDGVTATLQGWGIGDYNVVRSDYEIRQVVAAQSTNCRGTPRD